MDKRLAKNHKRKVARARERVKISEPDVRTPEEIAAAREASRAPIGRSSDTNVRLNSQTRGGHTPGTGSAAKTDA